MPASGPSTRWRGHVKTALAAAIARTWSHQVAAALTRPPYRPLVLGYHRVVEDFARSARTEMPSMLTGAAMFERHIDCLARHFRFVGLDEIARRAASGEPFLEPVAAVTFDDGYRDVFEVAFPILERRGIPGAVFVVTDLVDQPFWQIHDKLYHLVAKAFATWDDPRRELFDLLTRLGLPAAQMLRARAAASTPTLAVSSLLPSLSHDGVARVLAGLEASVGNGFHDIPQTLTWHMVRNLRRAGWTIGSHTRTHVTMPMEGPERLAEELEGSRRAIEAEIDEPCTQFAYPGGQFTPAAVDALARAGYQSAYTACPHGDARHPNLTIERLLLWEGSSVDAGGRFSADILDCQARDLWPPARACERTHHA